MIDAFDSAGRKLIVDRTNGPHRPEGGTGGACHYAEQSIDGTALEAIEAILRKGDRVEIIPVKDGVKIIRVRREVEKITNTVPASKR